MGSVPAVRRLPNYDFKMGPGPCDWRNRGWSWSVRGAKVGPRPRANDSISGHRRQGTDNGRNKTNRETGHSWDANQASGTNHRLRIIVLGSSRVQHTTGDGKRVPRGS